MHSDIHQGVVRDPPAEGELGTNGDINEGLGAAPPHSQNQLSASGTKSDCRVLESSRQRIHDFIVKIAQSMDYRMAFVSILSSGEELRVRAQAVADYLNYVWSHVKFRALV